MFKQFNLDIHVYRNDKIDLDFAKNLDPDYILISPGPKTPASAGISIPLIKKFQPTTPILGVCLGMQCINELYGGKTIKGPVPVHGKKSTIYHKGMGMFADIPEQFKAARYHSLIIEKESSKLLETAHTKDGIIMGIEHTEYPLFGIQFHPESFMTENGFTLIKNFLEAGKPENE